MYIFAPNSVGDAVLMFWLSEIASEMGFQISDFWFDWFFLRSLLIKWKNLKFHFLSFPQFFCKVLANFFSRRSDFLSIFWCHEGLQECLEILTNLEIPSQFLSILPSLSSRPFCQSEFAPIIWKVHLHSFPKTRRAPYLGTLQINRNPSILAKEWRCTFQGTFQKNIKIFEWS